MGAGVNGRDSLPQGIKSLPRPPPRKGYCMRIDGFTVPVFLVGLLVGFIIVPMFVKPPNLFGGKY